MCDKEKTKNNVFSRLPTVANADGPHAPLPLPVLDAASQFGSRRRRLWELPSQALCPVIGVCLPMPLLRRRLAKVLGGLTMGGDYELHCGAINDCNRRSPIAELLQKELDQRYAPALRLSAQHKTTEALTRWWATAQHGNDVPGALWATLTHARCNSVLQERVLRDIHMLQHQVGSTDRADMLRLGALAEENRVLGRELAQAQSRNTRLTQERAVEVERLQSDHLRMRAELVGRDNARGRPARRAAGAGSRRAGPAPSPGAGRADPPPARTHP